ncbi:hypothetical protein [Okeania sp. SIO2B3]|nr:hypothetical protein [Okeania sp. SIO2B3]
MVKLGVLRSQPTPRPSGGGEVRSQEERGKKEEELELKEKVFL